MYSNFILTPAEQEIENRDTTNNNKIRQENIKNIVAKYKLRELKSNYFGMSSYYYNDLTKKMYVVENI